MQLYQPFHPCLKNWRCEELNDIKAAFFTLLTEKKFWSLKFFFFKIKVSMTNDFQLIVLKNCLCLRGGGRSRNIVILILNGLLCLNWTNSIFWWKISFIVLCSQYYTSKVKLYLKTFQRLSSGFLSYVFKVFIENSDL